MNLNQLIEKLTALQKQGLGHCVVVSTYERSMISDIEILEMAGNEEEEGPLEWMLHNEEKIINQETIIQLLPGKHWYFGCQKDEELRLEAKRQKELQIKNLKNILGTNDIKDIVLHILKDKGLNNDRGVSPRDLFEIIGGTQSNLRDALIKLKRENLINSTGMARHLRYVSSEFYNEALKIYESPQKIDQ